MWFDSMCKSSLKKKMWTTATLIELPMLASAYIFDTIDISVKTYAWMLFPWYSCIFRSTATMTSIVYALLSPELLVGKLMCRFRRDDRGGFVVVVVFVPKSKSKSSVALSVPSVGSDVKSSISSKSDSFVKSANEFDSVVEFHAFSVALISWFSSLQSIGNWRKKKEKTKGICELVIHV